MQNRRDFIKQASLLHASEMVMPQLLGGVAASSSKHIGLQLYSLCDIVNNDGKICSKIQQGKGIWYDKL